MDPRLDGLLSSLEAQFGASIDRAEEEAAADLAHSLRQGMSLQEVLEQGSWVAFTELGPRAVCEVAKDHVRLEPGNHIVPMAAAVFEKGSGAPVLTSDRTLTQLLREEALLGTGVSVETGGRSFVGNVLECGGNHLVLASRGREVLVPLAQIRSIKLSLED